LSVAVIIHPVAGFRSAWVDCSIAVIAVAGGLRQFGEGVVVGGPGTGSLRGTGAIAVTIGIEVPRLAWELLVVGVVAVGIVGDKAGRSGTSLSGVVGITKSIVVVIGVEGSQYPFIDLSIAVVIYSVAGFGSTRVDGSIAVIAVPVLEDITGAGRLAVADRSTGSITVAITVEVVIAIGNVLVSLVVTVVIYSVAGFGSAWVNGGVRVIAVAAQEDVVGTGWLAVIDWRPGAVSIAVTVEVVIVIGNVLVGLAITVVIYPVAGFDSAWVDGGITVITVTVNLRQLGEGVVISGPGASGLRRTGAITVAIGVKVPGLPWELLVVGIVAVGIVGDKAGRSRASLSGVVEVAKSVVVVIGVEGSEYAFIDLSVAVVIYTVAGLSSTWIDSGVRVIAVAGSLHQLSGRIVVDRPGAVGLRRTNTIPIAIGIEMPDLSRELLVVRVVTIGIIGDKAGRSGASLSGGVGIAKSIVVDIGVESSQYAFIDLSVAVVIYPVTGFGSARVDSGITVIAVAGGLR